MLLGHVRTSQEFPTTLPARTSAHPGGSARPWGLFDSRVLRIEQSKACTCFSDILSLRKSCSNIGLPADARCPGWPWLSPPSYAAVFHLHARFPFPPCFVLFSDNNNTTGSRKNQSASRSKHSLSLNNLLALPLYFCYYGAQIRKSEETSAEWKARKGTQITSPGSGLLPAPDGIP
jgi:hypothetical protein